MHLGLIMDGNGRWANQRQMPRFKGHEAGVEAIKRVLLAAGGLGIDYLTLYAFSTENWKRPKDEVVFLMNLIAQKFESAVEFFSEHNIRVLVRGDLSGLPLDSRQALEKTISLTSSFTGMTVVFAINYGGHDEIARSVNKFIASNPGKAITAQDIENNLDNPCVPAPDLIARSAGEMRLSNFMLWDSAYAELLFLDKYWPDWGEEEIRYCLECLSKRVRKFGGLKNENV